MKLCIGMASGAYGRDADRSRARAIVGRENPPQVVSACAHERWARERASVRSLFVFTPIERLSMSVSADHAPSLLEGSAALSSASLGVALLGTPKLALANSLIDASS